MAVETGTSVRGDIGELNEYLGNYSKQIGELAGKWEGNSYDKLTSEANAFATECQKIGDGMEAFAKACDTYNNDYIPAKEGVKSYENEISRLESNNADGHNDGDIKECRAKRQEWQDKKDAALKSIKANLAEAASIKIKGASNFMTLGKLSVMSGITADGGNYMMLNFDYSKVTNKFGSQMDNRGIYSRDTAGCDDYARGYCIYIQSGVAPTRRSVSCDDSRSGLRSRQVNCRNRKEQAQFAFSLLEQGKPCVIHINSPSTGSGLGHWVTVVGCRQGVNKNNVTIADLVIMDPVTGTVRAMGEDKEYLRNDLGRCRYEPGYHVNYYV